MTNPGGPGPNGAPGSLPNFGKSSEMPPAMGPLINPPSATPTSTPNAGTEKTPAVPVSNPNSAIVPIIPPAAQPMGAIMGPNVGVPTPPPVFPESTPVFPRPEAPVPPTLPASNDTGPSLTPPSLTPGR